MDNIDGIDIEGKHVVLREDVMGAAYRDLTWRVALAKGGFGCSPRAAGSAVFIQHVRDGEECRRERDEIERLATDEEVSAARVAGGQDVV